MLNIVLINYNTSEDTFNCINSIINSNTFLDISIFVIDNASKEEDKSKLISFKETLTHNNPYIKKIEFIYSDKNLGFSGANNQILKLIPDNEFAWILNNDTLVNETLIEKISHNLPSDNQVLYFDAYNFENVFHNSGLMYVNLITGRSKTKQTSKNDFPFISGASFIIKKTPKMPYWCEDYFLYYEDSDYTFKLLENGYSFVHLDNCYFNHKISASYKKTKDSKNRIRMKSQIMFMKRFGKHLFLFKLSRFFILLSKRDFTGIKLFFSLYKTTF